MPTAVITAASNGDNTAVAGVTGYAIRVISFVLTFSAAVNAKFTDGAGGTALTGLLYGIGTGPQPIVCTAPSGLARGQFQTTTGNALVLNLSGATAVGGFIVYETIPQ